MSASSLSVGTGCENTPADGAAVDVPLAPFGRGGVLVREASAACLRWSHAIYPHMEACQRTLSTQFYRDAESTWQCISHALCKSKWPVAVDCFRVS